MPVKRMRMRPWLETKIESQSITGLMWIDKERKTFSIPWKHAARQGWDMGKDASLFREWAIHTGKFVPGITTPDPKTWKANFRCAMRSLPDIEEVKDQSVNKGSAAMRVYRMLHNVTKNKDSKPKAKDGRRKSKGSRSHVSTESTNPRDGNQSEDQNTESSMEDETVSSTENIVSSTHQYCEEEEVPEWASSAQIISNGTDDLHFPFQVSPLHSSGFGDGETVIIEMAKELEEQMQWQQSNVDGKGFLSNEVGAADSSHSQDSIYSGAESDFKFCLTSESREGVNVFEPGNTSLTFFTAQTICCPL